MGEQFDPAAAVKVVESWNAAWMKRDLEGMKAIAHDDYIQWHSTIRKDLSKAEEFDMLVEALKVMQIQFHDIKLTPLDNGVLQQCLGDIQITNGGMAKDVPFAMIYRIKEGKLARCDEYMDGMSLPQLDFTPKD
jgi:ketosteroid isomerase-like protein